MRVQAVAALVVVAAHLLVQAVRVVRAAMVLSMPIVRPLKMASQVLAAELVQVVAAAAVVGAQVRSANLAVRAAVGKLPSTGSALGNHFAVLGVRRSRSSLGSVQTGSFSGFLTVQYISSVFPYSRILTQAPSVSLTRSACDAHPVTAIAITAHKICFMFRVSVNHINYLMCIYGLTSYLF